MLTYINYVSFYNKYNKLPNGQYCSKKKLNEKQLKSKYEKYCKSINKQKLARKRQLTRQKNKGYINNKKQKNDRWLKCKAIVFERDNNKCRLWPLLNSQERSQVISYLYDDSEFSILDPAHIIAQSQSNKLQYNPDNVISLFRLFHTRLDNYQNPITGKYFEGATKQERKQKRKNWFIRIIGKELFTWLENNR